MTSRTDLTDDLSWMQDVNEARMLDAGKVGTWSGTQQANGEIVDSWTYGDAVGCGFRYMQRRELKRESGEILAVDAEIRLPIGTTITEKDTFKLTHRYGTDITDEIYKVVGYPERGPAGLLVLLEAVEE